MQMRVVAKKHKHVLGPKINKKLKGKGCKYENQGESMAKTSRSKG